ncbi:Uma2 family endonuclease [Mesorhizobium sp. BAC0120]|uniref:Uma2 family endonuclease n=1 Tax=Mesorhizobium sp. BAC0120 TaxID=3090670 RepID=UPI00298C7D13|nr:Uma2 family endonuclease [Mesorhizobium sp. BAC0120]MDW6024511.1 Uma2 family endonuclease [Mesorhizobium sp. BAC0120]
MNLQSRYPTTPDEFLRWNEGRESKWDFVEGRIVDTMVRVSRNHAIIAGRLTTILGQSLTFPPYTVSTANFGVKTATSVRYPDVMVDGAAGSANDLAAASPIFIAEILSPSTLAVDFHHKASEYQSVETLRHYLILAQDGPRVWLWSKEPAGWSKPAMVEGLDSEVLLQGLGLTIRLQSIYAGLLD